jgi:hypothetical protein
VAGWPVAPASSRLGVSGLAKAKPANVHAAAKVAALRIVVVLVLVMALPPVLLGPVLRD